VCFDLYQQAKGGYLMRSAAMMFVTIDMLVRLHNRQEYLLKTDGLWNDKTKKQARDLLWGKDGIMRVLAPYLLQYFRPDFHPWETDERRDLLAKFGREMQIIDDQQRSAQAA
jgi:predicted metal-dependent hydrolase